MLSSHTPNKAYRLASYIHSTFHNLLLLSCSDALKYLRNTPTVLTSNVHIPMLWLVHLEKYCYLNCSLPHPDFRFPRLYRSFIILTVSKLSCQTRREETKIKGWWVRWWKSMLKAAFHLVVCLGLAVFHIGLMMK